MELRKHDILVPLRDMVYSPKHITEVLHWERWIYVDDNGNIVEHAIVILNLGTHPTAYVRCDNAHVSEKRAEEILDVHGGMTFYGNLRSFDGVWYGWDYAHYNDFMGYDIQFPMLKNEGYHWATHEILDEAYKALETLKREVFNDEP